MTQLFTLFSSSAGNCACLSSGATTLLIDAGGNCKKISEALLGHGIDPQSLNGILLTHEHTDHISALKVWRKRCPVPVYSRPGTLQYLADHDLVPPNADLIPVEEGGVIGDISFAVFPTLHDCADPCGYTFSLPDGRKIGVATDLGRFTDVVFDSLCGSDIVVLESNYDRNMLEVSGYPYPLIRRIKSDTGHLSNDDCAGAVLRLVRQGVRRLILAHTSKQNNFEELAWRTTYDTLQQEDLQPDEITLEVAPKFTCSPVIAV